MVEYRDIKKTGCFPDFLGQFFVGMTGPQIARRVIMAKDNADGFFFQRLSQDHARVRHGTAHTAGTDDLKMVHFIGPVQEENGKNFDVMNLQTLRKLKTK